MWQGRMTKVFFIFQGARGWITADATHSWHARAGIMSSPPLHLLLGAFVFLFLKLAWLIRVWFEDDGKMDRVDLPFRILHCGAYVQSLLTSVPNLKMNYFVQFVPQTSDARHHIPVVFHTDRLHSRLLIILDSSQFHIRWWSIARRILVYLLIFLT